MGRHEAAESTFRMAIEGFDAQLRVAPEGVGIMDNRGSAARGVGMAQIELAQYDRASATLAEAVAVYDQALHLAPTDVDALSDRGDTLRLIGDLHVIAGEFEEAVDCYKQAIQAQEATLQIAPNIATAHTFLATAREKLDAVLSQMQADESAA